MLGMPSTAHTLEEHTKEYWRVSNIITGRSTKRISCADALDSTNFLEKHLGPQRSLLRSVRGLAATVIEGRRIKKNIPATIILLHLQHG